MYSFKWQRTWRVSLPAVVSKLLTSFNNKDFSEDETAYQAARFMRTPVSVEMVKNVALLAVNGLMTKIA